MFSTPPQIEDHESIQSCYTYWFDTIFTDNAVKKDMHWNLIISPKKGDSNLTWKKVSVNSAMTSYLISPKTFQFIHGLVMQLV